MTTISFFNYNKGQRLLLIFQVYLRLGNKKKGGGGTQFSLFKTAWGRR